MPIEYLPSTLLSVAVGEYAAKRLKNRNGTMECLECGVHDDGPILTMTKSATAHLALFPEHNVKIVEDCCRQCLIYTNK
jgi:hypothetical protein